MPDHKMTFGQEMASLGPIFDFHNQGRTKKPDIDYEKLARAVVDEIERREVMRGERLIGNKKRMG